MIMLPSATEALAEAVTCLRQAADAEHAVAETMIAVARAWMSLSTHLFQAAAAGGSCVQAPPAGAGSEP